MAGGGACASAFRAVVLLDTNVVSAVMLQRPEPAVVAWLDQVDPRQVWLPSVVVFELRYGAALHPDATRRRALELNLNRLIDELIQERIASLDAASAQKAAQLAAQRKTQGRTVDLRETLIAGIALANQAQLATQAQKQEGIGDLRPAQGDRGAGECSGKSRKAGACADSCCGDWRRSMVNGT